jgi:hypothetical protein
MVDGEKLVSKYLRTATNARVVGKPPRETDTAWVMVTQLDAASDLHPQRLVSFYFQIDVYAGEAGGQPEVSTLAGSIRDALADIPGSYADGVVTGATINGDARNWDADFKPPRDRRQLTVTVWAHA